MYNTAIMEKPDAARGSDSDEYTYVVENIERYKRCSRSRYILLFSSSAAYI